jgi:hypothetical protein
MTPRDWAEMSYEAFMHGSILSAAPNDLPSIRDARIQSNKLVRMLTEQTHQTNYFGEGGKALGGSSLKKWNKRRGKIAKQIGQQAGKARALYGKVLKEIWRRKNPALTNAEYKTWRKTVDSTISNHVKRLTSDFMKTATETAIKNLTQGSGFSQITRTRK